MRCPGCQADCPPDARFCRSCGSAFPPLCRSCGTRAAAADVRFCRSCGTVLGGASPAPAPPAPGAFPVPAATAPTAATGAPPGHDAAPQPESAEAWPVVLEPEEEPPLAFSQVVQIATKAGRAVRDPQSLLRPAAAAGAASRLNLLELLSMAGVGGLIGLFYAFGLLMFGFVQMLTSGTPFFALYALGLMVALALFRNQLDKPLQPLFRALQKVPPWLRLLLGVLAPLAWVLYDSKDVGSGFTHAMKTVTIATALGHVFFRSLRRPS